MSSIIEGSNAGPTDEHEGREAIDTRFFASGAALRLLLLVVLVAASTVTMLDNHLFLTRLLGDPLNDTFGCEMAAGFDPTASPMANVAALAGVNSTALQTCLDRYGAPPWGPYVVVISLLLVSAVVWWVMPSVSIWRRSLRPMSSGDLDALGDLVDLAGLQRAPAFLVDPCGGLRL